MQSCVKISYTLFNNLDVVVHPHMKSIHLRYFHDEVGAPDAVLEAKQIHMEMASLGRVQMDISAEGSNGTRMDGKEVVHKEVQGNMAKNHIQGEDSGNGSCSDASSMYDDKQSLELALEEGKTEEHSTVEANTSNPTRRN